MTLLVCWKFVVPVGSDDRFGGVSAADESALEWALRHGAARGEPVVVVSVGDAAADVVLRDAVSRGAERAVRMDLPRNADSAVVAVGLAQIAQRERATFVWCGDYSADRGTGSVPAFVAAHLGSRQALGLVGVTLGEGETVEVMRRLDGGRRERLRVDGPAVLSVEGGTAMLRRAPLRAALAGRATPVELVAMAPSGEPDGGPATVSCRLYRPRARVLPGPTGATALDRVRSILQPAGLAGAATSGRADPVVLDPPAAAARILEALHNWGYRS